MKEKRMYLSDLAVLKAVLLLCLFSTFSFAQEGENASVAPSVDPSVVKEAECIPPPPSEEDIMKERALVPIIAYWAVREGDISICQKSKEFYDCQNKVESINVLKNLADQDCEKISNRYWWEICRKLQKNSCQELLSWERDVCELLLNQDISLIDKIIQNPGFREALGEAERKDLLEGLAFYSGIKLRDGKNSCKQFTSELPMSQKLMCEVYFSAIGAETAVRNIARDIIEFTSLKANDEADTESCEWIRHEEIRDACRNPGIKEWTDFWQE